MFSVIINLTFKVYTMYFDKIIYSLESITRHQVNSVYRLMANASDHRLSANQMVNVHFSLETMVDSGE